jgi:hypothetical protein
MGSNHGKAVGPVEARLTYGLGLEPVKVCVWKRADDIYYLEGYQAVGYFHPDTCEGRLYVAKGDERAWPKYVTGPWGQLGEKGTVAEPHTFDREFVADVVKAMADIPVGQSPPAPEWFREKWGFSWGTPGQAKSEVCKAYEEVQPVVTSQELVTQPDDVPPWEKQEEALLEPDLAVGQRILYEDFDDEKWDGNSDPPLKAGVLTKIETTRRGAALYSIKPEVGESFQTFDKPLPRVAIPFCEPKQPVPPPPITPAIAEKPPWED